MLIRRIAAACFVGAFALASVANAQEPKVETFAEGLTNPTGLAFQPETGTLFVADSGASKVVRIVDGKAQDVIVGFGEDVYGKGPKYVIGPLGLHFLDKKTLVVGGGGYPDQKDKLYVFELPDEQTEPLKAEQATETFELGQEGDVPPEGNYYALAGDESGVYVTANGDDTKGWVGKLALNGTKRGPFTRFIATKEAINVDAPVGIAISPRGEIVVGQMGEINLPTDSQLTFYNPKSGEMLMNLPCGLHDVAGVAYSPKGQLYAVDFAWLDASQGGLFQLVSKNDGGEQSIEPKKIAAIDKPTALAFGPDGSLYITAIGSPAEGATGAKEGLEAAGAGKVYKIGPGL